jgi:hypothetical protein
MALEKIRKKAKWLLVVFAIVASISVVNAALFVYYDASITAQGQRPPVVFAPGKNANGADLWGNTIGVTIDSTNTTLTITVHPTYRTHFYRNITLIVNQDTVNSYYLAFNIITPFTNTKITQAKLFIRSLDGSTTYATINLLTTGVQGWPITLAGNQKLRIDLFLVITPGASDTFNNAPFTSDSCTLQLVYSPQNAETPPASSSGP